MTNKKSFIHFVSVIPDDIVDIFQKDDIELIWDFLQKQFGINKKSWRAKFEDVYQKNIESYSKQEMFMRFGRQHFQKTLNVLLDRNEMHPTWTNLVRYVLKSKINTHPRNRHMRFATNYRLPPTYA